MQIARCIRVRRKVPRVKKKPRVRVSGKTTDWRLQVKGKEGGEKMRVGMTKSPLYAYCYGELWKMKW